MVERGGSRGVMIKIPLSTMGSAFANIAVHEEEANKVSPNEIQHKFYAEEILTSMLLMLLLLLWLPVHQPMLPLSIQIGFI